MQHHLHLRCVNLNALMLSHQKIEASENPVERWRVPLEAIQYNFLELAKKKNNATLEVTYNLATNSETNIEEVLWLSRTPKSFTMASQRS